MLHSLRRLSTLLLPEPESVACVRHADDAAMQGCFAPSMNSTVLTLSDYREPLVRHAITANKFHHHRRAAALLATLLARWLASERGSPVFVPIPLGAARERKRGHNQVTSVVRALPEVRPSMMRTDLLVRQRETAPQTTLPADERVHNVAGAFRAVSSPRPSLCVPSTIILLDDVTTTGATLAAARAALAPMLPPGCQLRCVAIARSGGS